MSTTCSSILFYDQKITTTRSGATHRKDASDELFGFVLDEERWGCCLGSGGVDKLDKPSKSSSMESIRFVKRSSAVFPMPQYDKLKLSRFMFI